MSKARDKLLVKFGKLILIYYNNFFYTYKLKIQAHNKVIKYKNYTFDNNI